MGQHKVWQLGLGGGYAVQPTCFLVLMPLGPAFLVCPDEGQGQFSCLWQQARSETGSPTLMLLVLALLHPLHQSQTSCTATGRGIVSSLKFCSHLWVRLAHCSHAFWLVLPKLMFSRWLILGHTTRASSVVLLRLGVGPVCLWASLCATVCWVSSALMPASMSF